MTKLTPVLLPLFALAACNSEPAVDVKDASPEEVASAVADAGGGDTVVRPGKWSTKVTVDEISMPGMPAGMADQMKSNFAAKEAIESCVTPEEAARPKEGFFANGQKNCKFDRFTMGGGRYDTEMTCKDGAAEVNIVAQGTFSPDHYAGRSTMTMANAGPGGSMKISTSVEANRIGDCEG